MRVISGSRLEICGLIKRYDFPTAAIVKLASDDSCELLRSITSGGSSMLDFFRLPSPTDGFSGSQVAPVSKIKTSVLPRLSDLQRLLVSKLIAARKVDPHYLTSSYGLLFEEGGTKREHQTNFPCTELINTKDTNFL